MRDMLRQRVINDDTLVWTNSFGSVWTPLGKTNLAFNRVAAPPPLPRRKRRRLLRGALLAGFVLFWLLGGFGLILGRLGWVLQHAGVDTETLMSDQLPKCSSATAKSLAKQALEGAPASKMINVTAFDIVDPVEVSFDSASEKRHCKALALLNSGRREISFSLEWINKADKSVWLEIEDVPF
jgi:hypothetical protein